MNKKKLLILGCCLALVAGVAAYCHSSSAADPEAAAEAAAAKLGPVGPAFCTDTAYAYLQAQCDFGPRPMNTPAHEACARWIADKFRQHGCAVELQQATLTAYDGTPLRATNIIARYQPDATTRVMLCAHYDSRPWADNDPDTTARRKPILAANDAASGVGVMLELARLVRSEKLTTTDGGQPLGIDFVCFDAEDWGQPDWDKAQNQSATDGGWALGAQHFADNLDPARAPRYAILLDMVGAEAAQFCKEGFSKQYAPEVVKRVWRAAKQAGFAHYFPAKDGGWVNDDHLPLNQTAHVPAIDIIPYFPDCPQSSFGPTWHTLADDMAHISRETLRAVGQTLVQVLHTEK